LPSGIIALRHLPPAGRGARACALVTSEGIGGTAPSWDGCGRAGVSGCGSGAGSVMVFSSGQVRTRRSVADDRHVLRRQPAGTLRRGDENAGGR
jgi:hypothetical protein